jgi:hypothetical protein
VSEYQPCFIFGMSGVQISVRGPATQTEASGASLRSLETNVGGGPHIWLLPVTFTFLPRRCGDGLRDGRPGFYSRFSTASRPALWPTQPPIQWVPGTLSPGVKRQGREADHSPPSSAEVKNDGATPPLPHVFMA